MYKFGRGALVLTQNYFPEMIGSGPYVTDLAEHLASHGWSVDVVTNRPNYPTGEVPEDFRYGQKDHEIIRGVAVRRVRPHISKNRGALARLIAEGGFLLRGLFALSAIRRHKHSIVVSLCPSIFTVLLGWLAAGRRGKHIALVHDIQSGLAAGLNILGDGRAVRILRRLEAFALNRADIVLVLSDQMREQLRAIGVGSEIEILPIWIDTDTVTPREIPPANEITLMYSGNFGKKQSLTQVVEMAGLLQKRGSGIKIMLRGQGGESEALKAKARSLALDNVGFGPLVPQQYLAESLSQADIHIVSQHPKIADFAVPSKVYTIMASGRPFIAAAPRESLLWHLSAQSKAFVCVPSGDTEALAATAEALAADRDARIEMGRNGRDYVVRMHDRSLILDRFMSLVSSPERADDRAA